MQVDEFTARFWDLSWDLCQPHIPVGNHQVLGWANGIYQQGEDCRLMCELARRGFPVDQTAARGHRHEWRCLLQVGDDFALYDDLWADGGTIAFMIRDDDLRRRDFTQCWCVLSST